MKHLHKTLSYITLAAVLLFAATPVWSQNANRTADTKIVDALNQLPATDNALYVRLMDDIVSTGSNGLDLLVEMLNKKGASAIKVQYAISGLASYASAQGFDTTSRRAIINTFEKELQRLTAVDNPDLDLIEFYRRQLNVLGVQRAVKVSPVTIDEKTARKNLTKATSAAKKDPSELNIALRCAALDQLIDAAGPVGAEKVILKAIADPCREYRFAAFNALSRRDPSVLYDNITALFPKLNDDACKDLIYWLGEQKDSHNASALMPFLSSDDFEKVKESAWALTKMRSVEALKCIEGFLTSSDIRYISLAEECLKSSYGDISSDIAMEYDRAETEGKVAIIRLLSIRRAVAQQDIIFAGLELPDNDIRFACYAALCNVVTYQDFERLCNILETCDIAFAESVRQAIMSSISGLSVQEQNTILIARKEKLEGMDQNRYWPMIIKTSDADALYDIVLHFKNHPNPTSPSTGAINLYTTAFDAYLKMCNNTSIPGAQRLLMLRKAMDVAPGDNERNDVLKSVSRTGTFLGILYAGSFIEQPSLQQSAAQAVRLLALDNPSYHSAAVTALLKRFCEVVTGPDAQYEITSVEKHLEGLPSDTGFVSMFDGQTLSQWKGLVENPFVRAKMKPKALAKAQLEADKRMNDNWKVEDGCIVYEGKGFDNLCSQKLYGDFEMYIDWLLFPEGPEADAGIYLRGTPQVQIWDTARVDVGAQVGSGGLYNNVKNQSKPICVADNRLGQWNSFYIKMIGERVTVYLNGVLVVDNVVLENYWDRSYPIFPIEQIELQAHGSKVAYRNLYIRELPRVEPIALSEQEAKEGFELLFDGTTLNKWQGNKIDYTTSDGTIEVLPTGQGFGNLYTNEEYSDFVYRFEFKLTPGANNGVGIRTPLEGDAAYVGMEIQILDHYDPIYQPWLRDYQYHGSVYGIIPAQDRDAFHPVGEWNEEEIYAKGDYIKVTLNGKVITEGNIREATVNGNYDHNEHPGLFNKSGYIAFLGHGSPLWIRNVRIKRL